MIRRLLRDLLVRVTLGALALQALLLGLLPVQPRAAIAYWSDACLLTLVVVAAVGAWRAADRSAERRFWQLFAAAMVTWLVTSVSDRFLPSTAPSDRYYVLTDCLDLGFYFTLILAFGLRPEQPRGPGRVVSPVMLEWVGGVVFGFSLLAYFVLLPYQVNKPAYTTLVSSLSGFVLLDLFIVGRLAWLAVGAGPGRWRAVYGLMALGFALCAAHDTRELSEYIRGLGDEAGGPWDLVWTSQFVALAGAIAAFRLEPDGQRAAGPRVPGSSGVTPLAAFSFALPLAHLAGRASGLFDPVTDPARQLLVVIVTPVLGGLAVGHQALLERRQRHLRQDLASTLEQLQEARKMEALGRLASGVAGEFTRLLAVVLGYSEVGLERCGDDQRIAQPMEEIRQAAERALALTRQLTTFSERRLATAGRFEADAAVTAIAPLLQRMAGPQVILTTACRASGCFVAADPNQFDRALINLVANARDAMPEGGWLHVSTERVEWSEDDDRRPASLRPGTYVRVSVIDGGSGMGSEVRSRIFEPFFTTRKPSDHPGLGLSVVYGIVMQAGGDVEVETEPGRGTTIRLLLPTVPGDAPAIEPEEWAGARPTILVVDDDEGFREWMAASLTDGGYAVITARDGRAALDVAARHEGRIDLLASDLDMPGLDGSRLAERLRPGRPEMRFLFVSGRPAEQISLVAARTGGASLAKPFTAEALLQACFQLLDNGPPPGNPS